MSEKFFQKKWKKCLTNGIEKSILCKLSRETVGWTDETETPDDLKRHLCTLKIEQCKKTAYANKHQEKGFRLGFGKPVKGDWNRETEVEQIL